MSFLSTNSEADYELVVDERKEVATDILEISFLRADGEELPVWEPGSHIDLHLSNGLTRQYSLVPDYSGKNRWVVTVLVENDGRGGSLHISKSLIPGTTVSARGTRNHFAIEPATEYLFIAGGIGVTPLLAMIDVAETASIPWRLFYLGRSEKTMAYVTELLSKFGEKVVIVTKDSGQRLDVAQEITSAGPEVHVYCCGPERLMVAVEEALGESQSSRCHVERFHPRAVESHEPDVDIEVYCQKSDVELIVPADESILMTLDFAGVEIEGDCMEGTCGSCETRVISGTVEHRDSILSADAQKNGDTMMICVSRARGRLVLDL